MEASWIPKRCFFIFRFTNLSAGTNYFWLTYDIPSGATDGNLADAECNQITIGSNYVPTVQAPTGARTIRGPLNGSYNVGLTPFNEKSGKNINIEKRTRKVEKWIYESINSEKIVTAGGEILAPEKPFAYEKPTQTEMVDEDYFIFVENGAPYTGTLSIEHKKEVPTETGRNLLKLNLLQP